MEIFQQRPFNRSAHPVGAVFGDGRGHGAGNPIGMESNNEHCCDRHFISSRSGFRWSERRSIHHRTNSCQHLGSERTRCRCNDRHSAAARRFVRQRIGIATIACAQGTTTFLDSSAVRISAAASAFVSASALNLFLLDCFFFV